VPNCNSNPSSVRPGGIAITPAFAMRMSRREEWNFSARAARMLSREEDRSHWMKVRGGQAQEWSFCASEMTAEPADALRPVK